MPFLVVKSCRFRQTARVKKHPRASIERGRGRAEWIVEGGAVAVGDVCGGRGWAEEGGQKRRWQGRVEVA